MDKNQHKLMSVGDRLTLLGELEHVRRHALRSYVSTCKDGRDGDTFYLVKANQARELRRKLQAQWFPSVAEPDWCLAKTAVSLRQLSYEIFDGDADTLFALDQFCDDLLEHATKEDLSACVSCREDKAKVETA